MKTMFSKLLIVTLALSTLSAHAEGKSTSRKKAAIVAAVVAGTAAVAGLTYWKWNVVTSFVPFLAAKKAEAVAEKPAASQEAVPYDQLPWYKKLFLNRKEDVNPNQRDRLAESLNGLKDSAKKMPDQANHVDSLPIVSE